jgi:hypothetical protein
MVDPTTLSDDQKQGILKTLFAKVVPEGATTFEAFMAGGKMMAEQSQIAHGSCLALLMKRNEAPSLEHRVAGTFLALAMMALPMLATPTPEMIAELAGVSVEAATWAVERQAAAERQAAVDAATFAAEVVGADA